MSRHTVLAQELYRLSLRSEKLISRTLFSRRFTTELNRTLSAMQFLCSCLQEETIREGKAQIIIGMLEDILHTRYFDVAERLLNEGETEIYTAQQKEILFDLSCTASLCISSLCSKEKNRKETVRRYILSIRTMTQALLPPAHPDRLSAEEANRRYSSLLKHD